MQNNSRLASDIEALNEWVRVTTLRRAGRTTSLRSDRARASRLRTLATLQGVESLEDLAVSLTDRSAVKALLDRLWAKYAPGSVRGFLDALAVLGRFAVGQGWVLSLAIEGTDRPAAPQRPIQVYDPDDVKLLIRVAKQADLRWWAFLCFLADTGRRVGEALDLEWSWLTPGEHFHLPTTKTGKQQYVPLSARLAREVFTPDNIGALQAQKPKRHETFHRDHRVYVFPWGYSTVHRRLRRDCDRLGIECRGFHNFRHTKATELLGRGVPIQAVAALLGHSNVGTTDRVYNHTTALAFAEYVK